jgi:short-subunit dehydrogenase
MPCVEIRNMELSGKVAIITGASRGIGRALAKELAKHNCSLLLTALEKDEVSSLSDELGAYPVSVAFMAADLSDPGPRGEFVDWVLQQNGHPDILVNNVGMGGNFGRFEGQELSNIEKTIVLNLFPLAHLTHALIPVLKKRPCAKIVNISSGIARLPYPGLAVYGGTKAFISSFSESLSCELVGTSINVLCFHPGFTMTPFISTSKMDLGKIPRGFIHTPEEVASRLVRAIEKDKQWDYSDVATRFSASFGAILPSRLRTSIFGNVFWRLHDAK